jgi:hypothetical protein
MTTHSKTPGSPPRPPPSPLCPSCERFIGPVGKCPYCDADARKMPMMVAVRIVAILLATVGLGLLYAAARHREPPVVQIESITPVMNFAHVRIVGSVSKRAYIGKDGDYISFSVADDSGSLRVAAYRDVARKLIATRHLPNAGDQVEVRGSLSVAADSAPKLYLKLPGHLTITTANLSGQTP